eukprot:scaffold20836_cov106-Isochrysis_galbana.AAC.1
MRRPVGRRRAASAGGVGGDEACPGSVLGGGVRREGGVCLAARGWRHRAGGGATWARMGGGDKAAGCEHGPAGCECRLAGCEHGPAGCEHGPAGCECRLAGCECRLAG